MRIVLFFDQIQSGTGGKEGANVELALEKGGMGSYMMFSEYIKNIGGTVQGLPLHIAVTVILRKIRNLFWKK